MEYIKLYTIVLVICYLEGANDKVFKFTLNNSSYFEIRASFF